VVRFVFESDPVAELVKGCRVVGVSFVVEIPTCTGSRNFGERVD